MIGQFVALGSNSLNGYERNKLYRRVGMSRGDGEGGIPLVADVAYFAGADRLEDGRGAAVFDIEGDGDLDIVVQNFERPAVLLVNQGDPVGNWLQVRLRGTTSNRDAIGARIEVEADGKKQVRELCSTAGYLAGQPLLAHFGLAGADEVDRITVHWPAGGKTEIEGIAANRRIEIEEPRMVGMRPEEAR